MKAPLFHQYPGQVRPQPAYLEIDARTGRAACDWSAETGNAVPVDVWARHILRFAIPNALSEAQIDYLLDRVAPYVERIKAGYSAEWDGNNYRAQYTENALSAIEMVEEECGQFNDEELLSIWDPAEWLDPCLSAFDKDDGRTNLISDDAVRAVFDGFGTVTAASTDQDLDALAATMEAQADSDGCTFTYPVATYLRYVRRDLIDPAAA